MKFEIENGKHIFNELNNLEIDLHDLMMGRNVDIKKDIVLVRNLKAYLVHLAEDTPIEMIEL